MGLHSFIPIDRLVNVPQGLVRLKFIVELVDCCVLVGVIGSGIEVVFLSFLEVAKFKDSLLH